MLTVTGTQALAQLVSSQSCVPTQTLTHRTGWNTFGVEYLEGLMKNGKYSESFSGIALLYSKSTGLGARFPLFLEYGIGVQYSFFSQSGVKSDIDVKWGSLKVPVNLIYDYRIPDSKVHLDPFVGFKIRVNIWGELKDISNGTIM